MRDWRNWAIMLLSMTLTVIAGEVSFRLLLQEKIKMFPRYHAAVAYGEFVIRRLQPEITFWHTSIDGSWQFTVNKQGFRDHRDFYYKKDKDILRVIILGDSHTQGFEVRQDRTYSAVIEKFLNKKGIKTEVINTGLSGFGTAEQAILLENEAMKYNPDMVVLGFYANDFEDNVRSGLYELRNGDLFVAKTRYAPGTGILEIHNSIPPLRWLSENLYLYSYFMNLTWNGAKRMLSTERGMEFAVSTRDANRDEKQLTARIVQKIYEICRSNSIELIIIDIPEALEEGGIKSSIPPELRSDFERNSDILISGEEIVQMYEGLAELHLPHGHHHISELTHMLLGVEAARGIQRMVANRRHR